MNLPFCEKPHLFQTIVSQGVKQNQNSTYGKPVNAEFRHVHFVHGSLAKNVFVGKCKRTNNGKKIPFKPV